MREYMLRIGIIALAGWCLSGNSLQAADIGHALNEAMQDDGEVAFIVHFADRVDLNTLPASGSGRGVLLADLIRSLRRQADVSQQSAVNLLRKGQASRIVQLWSINALAATARPEVIRQLAEVPGVERITLDTILAAPSPQPTAATLAEWNLEVIGAPDLWTMNLTGQNTVIAAIDTGVDVHHPDLATRWRGGTNSWFDPNGEHATPYDANGHGTQTLSIAVGGDAGGSAIGVAPDARWIAVKIFNDAGRATLSGIHQGFQWLLDPDGNPLTLDTPDVVNISWGFPELAGQCYLEFARDIEVLKAAGIAVVFAGGNQGSAGSVSPADNPEGFGVGAVDAALNVAAFSSRGPSACDGSFFPEVVAPGVGVRVADLTFGGLFPDAYASLSGTSFAVPHLAGTLALLRQAYPGASVAQLEAAVLTGATDIAAKGPDNDSGHGLLNAVAAHDWLVNNTHAPTCTDFDGDGFFAEEGCGTQVDCNDFDAGIHPLACDIKGDGIDQNCDGEDRLTGKPCPDAADEEEASKPVKGGGRDKNK